MLVAVEDALSPARLARFSGRARDKHHALRIYVWNARLCEEFYLPIQIAEVSTRNAIAKTLTRRFGEDWHSERGFTSLLTDKYKDELRGVVASEQKARGAAFTPDHVIAGMTFGFWVNLLTARYDQILWQGGVSRSFPHIPRGMDREAVYLKLDQLRKFRNKVAHHFAIFDRGPSSEYQNLIEVVALICPETLWLIRQLANPAKVIQQRPAK